MYLQLAAACRLVTIAEFSGIFQGGKAEAGTCLQNEQRFKL